MPQMAPLNWLILFLMFIMIYLMFNFINFYSFMYTPKISLFSKKIKSINWKW
uniref:ATP synthase complex subunit 8 n=1 Tax=Staphylinidae sp. BMNH 1274192 TaxID=1796556 RepID=A0A140EG92_9COLE|nr:ATP synthase F0 subunit 8 [Staphylinidae sp. BMNH 1274192]